MGTAKYSIFNIEGYNNNNNNEDEKYLRRYPLFLTLKRSIFIPMY